MKVLPLNTGGSQSYHSAICFATSWSIDHATFLRSGQIWSPQKKTKKFRCFWTIVSNWCCPLNTIIMAGHLPDSVYYPCAEGDGGTMLSWRDVCCHVPCHYRNKGCLTTERNQCQFAHKCLAEQQLLHWLNHQLTNRGKIQKLKETLQCCYVNFSLFLFQTVTWSGEVLLCSLRACCHGSDWNTTS